MKAQTKKAKKLGLKEIVIEMGLFDFTVVAIIGDYSKVEEYVQWKLDDPSVDTYGFDKGYIARGRVFFRRGYVPILWIPRKPKTPREHATLAHEALHCVYHLFDWAGIPMTLDTEEVATHALGHIVTVILEEV